MVEIIGKLVGELAKIRRHGVPESLTPDAEWNRQARKLAKLFAKELGFKTKEEYIATLPKFEPQPEEYRGRLDISVIVETRVPLERMLELIDVNTINFDIYSINDWENGNFKTPEKPYTAYLNDGSGNLDKSVEDVRNSLRIDERGGTIFDGIALYLKNPKILRKYNLDFPGSQVGYDRVPYLNHWIHFPKLRHHSVGIELPIFYSIIAGRKINVKP